MTVLRDGLLDGRAVALAGCPSADIASALGALGARIEKMPALDGSDEDKVGDWARSRSPLHALVYVAPPGAFGDLLAAAWAAVREIATGALIPGEHGGKIVLVAPRLERPVQAGLENLARTLSVEWARYGVTAVAVAPGPHAGEPELAETVCYLVSFAGDYFSGCRIDLGLTAVGD